MTLDVPSCLSIANYIRYWDGIHTQDAEDFSHDALLEMMERARRNGGGLSDKEMWRAARCVRSRYRRAYGKRPLSLNAPIRGVEEPIENSRRRWQAKTSTWMSGWTLELVLSSCPLGFAS